MIKYFLQFFFKRRYQYLLDIVEEKVHIYEIERQIYLYLGKHLGSSFKKTLETLISLLQVSEISPYKIFNINSKMYSIKSLI